MPGRVELNDREPGLRERGDDQVRAAISELQAELKKKEAAKRKEGDGGNVAIYITNEGVILVDDKFEYDYNDIMDKVKSVTSQPVRYVLNTHHHGDHTGSNAKFPPSTEFIAHVNARKNMIDGKQPGVLRQPGPHRRKRVKALGPRTREHEHSLVGTPGVGVADPNPVDGAVVHLDERGEIGARHDSPST